MNKLSFWTAFALGLAAVGWVGAGFAGSNWIAFAMTLAIASAFVLGAAELRRHRTDSAALTAALSDGRPVTSLAEWLQSLPAALRSGARQRIEDGRGALPGPALTPYLVGLLVMLGMLGTFLGMVVTFKGAVFALEGSTDLQAIRAALAEPIRGLGLSFGTSVAGVAASAMLGLMSAIARRERIAAVRLLDQAAGAALRPFSLAHQREETLRATQAQAAVLPAVVERLDALMARIDERSRQLDEGLRASQAGFHRDAGVAYTRLADEVGSALQRSLADGARAAGESIAPALADAVARIEQDTQRLHTHLGAAAQSQLDTLTGTWHSQLEALRREEGLRGDAAVQRLDALQAAVAQHLATLGAALEAPLARLLATASEVPQAAAGVLAQLRQEMAQLAQQENTALKERTVLVERLDTLLQTVEIAARSATDVSTQAGANAVELSTWGAAFAESVQLFHAGNEKLVAALQQVEGAVVRSAQRSDEQVAYYVAQAREVIDLSISSQHGVLERLRDLAGKPVGLAPGVKG